MKRTKTWTLEQTRVIFMWKQDLVVQNIALENAPALRICHILPVRLKRLILGVLAQI